MSQEVVELFGPMLGLSPYVLLRAESDDDGTLTINVKAGGGISTVEDIRAFLLLALSEFPEPVTA